MSRILRGFAALVVLITAVAAIPLSLLRFVGNPLPTRITDWSTVLSAIQRGEIVNDTVIKALALVVWIAWLRIAISVILEIWARATNASAPRVPGLGASQQWAASLLTTVLLIAGSYANVGASPVSRTPLHVLSTELLGRDPRPTAVDPAVYIVQRFDSFWSIAERELGDGARWNEIVELNRGRQVAPGIIFDGTPDKLLAGWELMLPPRTEPEVSANAQSVGHTVRVERGDSLTSIANDQLGSGQHWATLWQANRGRHFGQRTFDDPNLILPGWELIVPADPEPADPAPAEPAPIEVAPIDQAAGPTTTAPTTTTAPATTTPTTTETTNPGGSPTQITTPQAANPDPPRAETSTSHEASVPGGLGAAVLVSCGALGAVMARRRHQLRRAKVGSRLLEPTPIAATTETMLRSLDAAERVTRLDIAIRAGAAELAQRFADVALLGAIVHDSGRIELLLTAPVTSAPDQWQLAAPDRWVLEHDTDTSVLAQAARRVNQPCPALAHIGSTTSTTLPVDASSPAELFLDLEALGLLAIDAPGPLASDIVRAIAAGIMVSPLAEIAHVITYGLPDARLGHQSTRAADSLDIALDLAAGALGTTAVATSAGATTFALRSRQLGGEAWEPAIVLAAADEPDAHLDADLVSLTQSPGRGLAVVISRPIPGAKWTLQHDSDRWLLMPLGLDVIPVGLSSAEVSAVGALVDESARALLSPVGQIHQRVEIANSNIEFDESQWSLMVRLLGPTEVVDKALQPVSFERSKALELVVWLSQHREHSTRTGARTALWEFNVRDATFANVVSDARRAMSALVAPPEGIDWLGRTLTEQLPLHRGVVTDAELLEQRLAHAQRQEPIDAIRTLVPGLELVRGAPFAATNYLWPDPEGTTSRLILLVTSAATVLAKNYLVLGDTDGVFWATERGLRVLAGHEELIALRMRAHARGGNLAGVRAEWESYERALTADAWSDGEASPKLVALRRELLSPSLMRV